MIASLQRRVSFLLTSLSPFLAASGIAQTEAFLTHPDIHGNRVVYTAEGDLWLADATTGDSWRLTSDPGVETSAHFSPDGTQIAFTANYDGGNDVYVMPTLGGRPKRLTYDPSDSFLPGATVLGWTPEGRSILFTSSGKLIAPKFEQQMTQLLYTVPASGGVPSQVPVPRAAFASFNADGHTLAFVPATSLWMNWFRYHGGEADRIWLTDTRTGKFTRLTNTKEIDTEPVWVGSSIYFVSERSGTANLWKLDPVTQKAAQVTFSADVPVRFPSTDGSRIVFQLGPRIAVFDPVTGKSRLLSIRLHSDRIHARPFEQPIWTTDHSRFPSPASSVSPDGKRVALSSRGQLVTVAVGSGAMHVLVDDSSQRVQNPVWSPDGKLIAYTSDGSGEEQLYVVRDEDHSAPRKVTTDLAGEHGRPVWSPDNRRILIGDRTGEIQLVDSESGHIQTIAHDRGPVSGYQIEGDFSFSPDGKWIAYSTSLGWRLTSVFLYEIAAGKSILASDRNVDSSTPVFSLNGKYLFMLQQRAITQDWTLISGRMSQKYESKMTGVCLSNRTHLPNSVSASGQGNGNETVVDIDGLVSRSFDLGSPAGNYLGISPGQDKLIVQGTSDVLSCEIKSGKVTTLLAGGHMVELSPNGKNLLAEDSHGLRVVDVDGGSVAPDAGLIHLEGLTVAIDPEREWRQIFLETWRVWRDLFYDPNMHGIDWNQIRSRYEKQMPLVGSRYDLMLLLRDMISELHTGHSFTGAWPEFVGKPARPGVLGADLEWDPLAHAYKIARIFRGDAWDPAKRSPLAEPGVDVREGDYLLRIAGAPLRPDEDPAALLLGTSGREIEIVVNHRPTLEGAQTLTIKPLSSDSDLRLKDWIAGRRAYVEKASGGQIAYVYLSDMGSSGATGFAQQYYPNVDSPAMIIDVRGNDGGNISGNVLSDIGTHPMAFFAYRNGTNYRRESWAPLGRLAVVTNEWAFSDADYFSECFKRLKIGPLVGHRTIGGVVGPVIYPLVDGSGIGVPNYGAWIDGEWIVEGRGAVPDFEVDQDPAAIMSGKDPQLDKAISLLLEELKTHPFHAPQHPPYPIKRNG